MEITYYGHACFLINIHGKAILFDPFIGPNKLAAHIEIDAIQPDFILLSHGHQDHIADVERIAKHTGAQLIASHELVEYFKNNGLTNVHPMNHGGRIQFEFGELKMVNAVHSSSLPDGSYGGNPAGFVIKSADQAFYYAGDTALHLDMQLIAEDYNIDFAFLPIGNNFTMDIRDAIKAANFVQTEKIIGMHYDTFPYIEIDHDAVKKIAEKENKALLLMKIGEKVNI